MESFQQYRENALRHIKIADHMLAITYPLLKDPKLLITVLQNLANGMIADMNSLLFYERTFKRINIFGESVEERLHIFTHLARKHALLPKYQNAIQELREMLKEHKNSPMEFARKDKFIIYTEKQELKTISEETIKKYVVYAKEFHEEIAKLTSKNEGMFR